MVITIVHMNNKKILEENLFVNYTTGGYFYDIASYIVLVAILIIVNIFPRIGRNTKWLLCTLFYVCMAYILALWLNYSTKTYVL